jgi:putative endonuclease
MKKNEESNMFNVYILYSPSLSKYYVGSTSMDISERLARHLHDHQGFTSRAKDWEVIYTEKYDDKTEALSKEKTIKKRGAIRYLEQIGHL